MPESLPLYARQRYNRIRAGIIVGSFVVAAGLATVESVVGDGPPNALETVIDTAVFLGGTATSNPIARKFIPRPPLPTDVAPPR